MKCMIPEISWHNREPVLCVDIQPLENEFYRLATGGSDYHVLIWQGKIMDNGAVSLDLVSDLTRHQRAVNAVRWSPNGQYLASADDDANIIIWNLKTDNIPLLDGDTNDNKETWVITKIMRGHKEDIYDLCWSPSGLKIISGSIDNAAIVWDFTKGKAETILTDHKGFVQGVAWDPKGEYIATLSSDRICRLFEVNSKQVRARIGKGVLPVPESHFLYKKEVKYFHDDTFKSYFRRVNFTPDGNLIVAPAGCVETEENKKALFGTYLFTLDCLTQPVAILPLRKQSSVAVRCCPILFELRSDGPDPVINLPYRMIIAVATESDLILYDTQQLAPFAHLQKIHYTRLTDVSWSIDGRLLTACSTDGFCTLVTFEPNELGVPYTKEENEPEAVEESFMNISGCEELEKETSEIKNKEEKPKRESFLLQWAHKLKDGDDKISVNKPTEISNADTIKLNKKDRENKVEVETNNEKKDSNGIKHIIDTIDITDSPVKLEDPIKKLIPKRIVPIKLSSPGIKDKKKNTVSSKSTPTRRKSKQPDNSEQSKEAKSNALMSFLKVTTDNTKSKPAADCLTIDDSMSARDAWKCEENKDKTEKMDAEEIDDITGSAPDFKLQLEESTSEKCVDKRQENLSIALSHDADVEMKDENVEQKINIIDLNNLHKDNSTNDNKQITGSDEKPQVETKQVELTKIDNSIKKTPRRIPLITLSSPKHKKKQKE